MINAGDNNRISPLLRPPPNHPKQCVAAHRQQQTLCETRGGPATKS
jgi:hypothetical protein